MGYLLDASTLMALVVREHEAHEKASAWARDAEGLAVCPVVEGALVRFLVRVGEDARSATRIVAALRSRVEFWPDDVSYADLDLTVVRGHRQVTDAYLVGLAARRGGQLATLDVALSRTFPQHAVLVAAP